MAAYYGLITELDRNVGEILKAVSASASAENTAIIYVSDHGDMCCEHGMWWKSSFYEGSAGVPMIASWPGRFAEGVEESAVTSLIDVGPTLLDLAQAPSLPDVSGRSFLPFLRGNPIPDWPHLVFCEYTGLLGDQPSCMVRSERWKLNYYSEFDSCQLFDISADPEERNDLAGKPECAVIVNQLKARIESRWSAARIHEARAKQQRADSVLKNTGHPAQPHPVTNFSPGTDDNVFDFSQLPVKPRGIER